ncbi:MAG: hypothetical protein ACO3YU_02210 [Candidatus Nanopelagicales bacterium]
MIDYWANSQRPCCSPMASGRAASTTPDDVGTVAGGRTPWGVPASGPKFAGALDLHCGPGTARVTGLAQKVA